MCWGTSWNPKAYLKNLCLKKGENEFNDWEAIRKWGYWRLSLPLFFFSECGNILPLFFLLGSSMPDKIPLLSWPCMHACSVTSVVSDSLQPYGLYPARLLCPWDFSRQEYWSGLLCPPPGDLPTQGLNPGLPHCRLILYHLSHQGSPKILKWAAYPFFRGSSQPRNRTRVSWIAGRFFTNWAMSEAQPTQHINKQRHYFSDKGPSSQSYGFSSSHVWMWELDQ